MVSIPNWYFESMEQFRISSTRALVDKGLNSFDRLLRKFLNSPITKLLQVLEEAFSIRLKNSCFSLSGNREVSSFNFIQEA